MQHLKQSITRKTNPQVRPEHTTSVQNRQKAWNTLHNHQEPYTNCNNNPTAGNTIFKRPELFRTGYSYQTATK